MEGRVHSPADSSSDLEAVPTNQCALLLAEHYEALNAWPRPGVLITIHEPQCTKRPVCLPGVLLSRFAIIFTLVPAGKRPSAHCTNSEQLWPDLNSQDGCASLSLL